jgi:hypothetical protein
MSRQQQEIEALLGDYGNLPTVRTLYKSWMECYCEFPEVHDSYHELLPTTERERDHWDWYVDKDTKLKQFKLRMVNWLSEGEARLRKRETQMISEYHSSERSMTVVSGDRQRSVSSSISTRESVKFARAKESQKRAELVARAAALKDKHELEEEKLKLKMREEELQIVTEIKVADARVSVLDDFEKDEFGIDEGHIPTPRINFNVDVPEFIPRVKLKEQSTPVAQPVPRFERLHPPVWQGNPAVSLGGGCDRDINLEFSPSNPFSPAWVPGKIDMHSNLNGNDSFSQLDSVVKELRKPVSDIKKFAGDPLQYKKFLRQFESRVVTNTITSDERMNFLEQFTEGEANKIVSGYNHLDAECGYPAALCEFERRYGDCEIIANAFVKRALDWPLVKSDDPKGLDSLSIFLTECQNAVTSIDAVRVLDYSENLRRVVAKLPFYVQAKWRNLVFDRKERSEQVYFKDLVKMVQREAHKANDPTYGRAALMQDNSDKGKGGSNLKGSKPRTRGSFATEVDSVQPAAAADVHVKNIQGSKPSQSGQVNLNQNNGTTMKFASEKPCGFCKNHLHSFEHCRAFRAKPVKERVDYVKSKGLCWGCLRQGHQNKFCRNRATCDQCKQKHPTVLHDESKANNVSKGSDGPAKDTSGGRVAADSLCSTGAGNPGKCKRLFQ